MLNTQPPNKKPSYPPIVKNNETVWRLEFMPHKRSNEAKIKRSQRKTAKEIMYERSFQDRLNGDVVNLLRTEQVLEYLSKRFEGVTVEAVPSAAIPGCVLCDPYGAGAFQMEPKK